MVVRQGGAAVFDAYAKPVPAYTHGSCDIDLSGIPDASMLSSVSGCHRTVTLSGTWEKVSVPNYWATWSCPPFVESCTPNALWSSGQSTVTLDYNGRRIHRGGFELEPDLFQKDTVNVDFYAGHNGRGEHLGTITRTVDGSAGARLFAARMIPGFHSVVITDTAGDDFAIAQLRLRYPV